MQSKSYIATAIATATEVEAIKRERTSDEKVTFFSKRRCIECGDEFEVWGSTRRLTCGDQCQWHRRARLRKEAAARKTAAR